MLSRVDKITREPARHAADSVSDPGFRQLWPTLNIAQKCLRQLSHRAQVSEMEASAPKPVIGRESLGHVTQGCRKIASPRKGCFRLWRSETAHRSQCIAVDYLQS